MVFDKFFLFIFKVGGIEVHAKKQKAKCKPLPPPKTCTCTCTCPKKVYDGKSHLIHKKTATPISETGTAFNKHLFTVGKHWVHKSQRKLASKHIL